MRAGFACWLHPVSASSGCLQRGEALGHRRGQHNPDALGDRSRQGGRAWLLLNQHGAEQPPCCADGVRSCPSSWTGMAEEAENTTQQPHLGAASQPRHRAEIVRRCAESTGLRPSLEAESEFWMPLCMTCNVVFSNFKWKLALLNGKALTPFSVRLLSIFFSSYHLALRNPTQQT